MSILVSIKNGLPKDSPLFKDILDYARPKLALLEDMKKRVKEMSTTGGGAAPGTGAHAETGDGEGMATKFAFGGAGADPKKKRKKIKTVAEDTFSFLGHINSLKKDKKHI